MSVADRCRPGLMTAHIMPPMPASAVPGHEHADEEATDVIAEGLDHFAVLDPGPHQQADAGARRDQMHRSVDCDPEADSEQAIGLDRRAPMKMLPRSVAGFGERQGSAPQTTMIVAR